ncbi:MAG: hypothetical protein P8123_00675, partial [bacterium]
MTAPHTDPSRNVSKTNSRSADLDTTKSTGMALHGGMLTPSLAKLIDQLGNGVPLNVSDVFGSALAFLLVHIRERLKRPVVLVTKGPREIEEMAVDIETLGGEGSVACFPAWETLPGEELEPHPDISGERFLLMERLAVEGSNDDSAPLIIVTSLHALSQKAPLPCVFSSEILRLVPGVSVARDSLLRYLEEGGYLRVDMVENKGEYPVRGGIVDLFSPTAEYPLRIEFIGDEIETIRQFQPRSQRTVSEIAEGLITPVSELTLLRRHG